MYHMCSFGGWVFHLILHPEPFLLSSNTPQRNGFKWLHSVPSLAVLRFTWPPQYLGVLMNKWLKNNSYFFKKDFIYFQREGKGRRKRGRATSMYDWLPLVRPLLGTWPVTQACALTGNRTGNPLVRRPALSPLSHTSQGTTFTDTIETVPFYNFLWNINFLKNQDGPSRISYNIN